MKTTALAAGLVAVSVGSGLVWLLGTRNPYTPAGYVGYLTQGALFGKASYYGLQKGPTSTGRTWLVETVNVSITPYTYSESFTGNDSVLSRDNLKSRRRSRLRKPRRNGVSPKPKASPNRCKSLTSG